MYYCEGCRAENRWPEGLVKSLGTCEVCASTRVTCHDYPAKNLPPGPARPAKATSEPLSLSGSKQRQALRVLLGLDPAGTAEKQAACKALLPLLTPLAPRAPTQPFRLEVVVGDYRLVQGASGELVAYRHGELWRDCVGDQLICALGHRIEELERRGYESQRGSQ